MSRGRRQRSVHAETRPVASDCTLRERVVLARIADALELIASSLSRENQGRVDSRHETLLSRAEIARVLGVSVRWVDRHLTPSHRATPGGRAWYRRADVEAQLTTSGAGVDVAAPRLGSKRRSSRTPASSVDADVREVEAQLRASLAKPKRK